MGRWLAAITLLAGALAAGGVAFLNGGEPLPIRLTPERSVALPLGTALAFAFAAGMAVGRLLAPGGPAPPAAPRRPRPPRGAAAAEAATLRGLRFEAAVADRDVARSLRRLLGLAREHPGFVAAWVAAGDQLRARGRTIRARRVYERGARARPAAVLLERMAAL